MRSRHPLSDSTPHQDVRAAAEARGDATVRGTTTPKTKQQNLRFFAVGLAWMTIGTGDLAFFDSRCLICQHKNMLATRRE
jgi:hypothetical protein